MEVHTDSTRLGRLLGNLLNNAIRYTSTGRVRLHAGWISEGGKQTLILTVEDTGTGLATEDQESIFQPFHRGRAGKADSDSGGSGLGLAVVDRLIHELGLIFWRCSANRARAAVSLCCCQPKASGSARRGRSPQPYLGSREPAS